MTHDDGADDELAFMIKADDAGREDAVQASVEILPSDCAHRVRSPDVIHATLVHAGMAKDSRALAVAEVVAPLVRIPLFELVFDRCEWRPHPGQAPNGIAILRCSTTPPQWRTLRDRVSDITRRIGERKTGGEGPHLTVAYGCAPFDGLDLPTPVVWKVTEFQLIRILMGQKAHRELGRWSLQ